MKLARLFNSFKCENCLHLRNTCKWPAATERRFSTYSIFQTINLLRATPPATPPPRLARVDIYQKFQLSFIASARVCFAFSSTGRAGRRTRNWTCISLDFSLPHPRHPQEYTTSGNSLGLIDEKIRKPENGTWGATLPLAAIFRCSSENLWYALQIFCTTRDNCSVFPATQVKSGEGFSISPTLTCSTWRTFYRSQVRNLRFYRGRRRAERRVCVWR